MPFGILYSSFGHEKEAHRSAPLLGQSKRCQAILASRARASAVASLPRIKLRRIGLITNRASNAAMALSPTAMTNSARQPLLAATRLASGTSNEAVPFGVYNMPLLVVAYFTPNVSPLVAG